MKKHFLSVIALGVLGGLFLAGNSWSQDDKRPAAGTGGAAPPGSVAPSAAGGGPFGPGGALDGSGVLDGSGRKPGGGGVFFGGSFDSGLPGGGGGVLAPARSEIEQLMTHLRQADDDVKKAEITTLLRAAVAEYFDEDLKGRETELTKLEARLTKLRAQLDRRRKAKPEIIQLQIKVMVNEADGLGFSGTSVFDFEPSSTPGKTGGFSEDLLLPPSKR